MTQECSHSFVYNGFRLENKMFRPVRRFRSGFQKSRHHILSSCLFSFFFFLFSFFFFLFLSRFIKAPYPGFVLLDCSRFIKKQWLHELCFFLVTVLHINIIYDVSVRISAGYQSGY